MIEVRGELASGGRWIVCVAPDAAERDRLTSEHGVPAELIVHSLDLRERPRVDHEAGATLVVLRTPHRVVPEAELPWTTLPIGVVLCARDVVTICSEPSDVVPRAAGATDALEAPHLLLLAHLRGTADAYLGAVAQLEQAIDAEEARLDRSQGNREVLALVRLMKSLVHFTSALKSIEHVVERLTRAGSLGIPEDHHGALEDTLIEIRQAIDTVDLERETLAATMDAFASIISNNLNVVMKLLAALTLIVTPPLVLASLWGMNVPVPWTGEPWAFVALLAIALLGSLLTGIGLWRRHWL